MRVVVADDAVILREGLARLLEEAGFDVVGLASDADELCALVERTKPDVAIVDIRMPPTHTDEGLRAAKQIRARWPQVGILVLEIADDGIGGAATGGGSGLRGLADRVEALGGRLTLSSPPGRGTTVRAEIPCA